MKGVNGKSVLAGAIIGILAVGVSFAAFASTLTINGTAELTGDFDVKFTAASASDTKATTSDNVGIDVTNDNIVYMKMLINDNNCFRNLSSFVGDKAYRKYQELYGAQNNGFKLLIITTNYFHNKSKAWIYSCRLPRLNYDDLGNPTDEDTIEIEENVQDEVEVE